MKPFQLIFNYARTIQIRAHSHHRQYAGPWSGLQLLIPWVVKLLVDEITAPGASMADMAYVARLTVIVLFVFIARAGLQFVRSYEAHVAGWGVVADVRKYVYDHMQRLSLRFYEDKQVGQLMSNVVNDTDLFEQFIAHAIPDVVVNAVTLFGGDRRPVHPELAIGAAQPDSHPAGDRCPCGCMPNMSARLSATARSSSAT